MQSFCVGFMLSTRRHRAPPALALRHTKALAPVRDNEDVITPAPQKFLRSASDFPGAFALAVILIRPYSGATKAKDSPFRVNSKRIHECYIRWIRIYDALQPTASVPWRSPSAARRAPVAPVGTDITTQGHGEWLPAPCHGYTEWCCLTAVRCAEQKVLDKWS